MTLAEIDTRVAIGEEQMMLKSDEDAAIEARFIARDREIAAALRLLADLNC